MKKLALILALGFLAGCLPTPEGEADISSEMDKLREAIREEAPPATMNAKVIAKTEKGDMLASIERDLAALQKEREEWKAKEPSQEKIARLQEIAVQEKNLLAHREQLETDIAVLEGRAPKPPTDADSALELMEKVTSEQEKTMAEILAEREAAKRKREEEAAAKEGDLAKLKDERAKLEAALGASGALREGSMFEETYADVILQVLTQLQKYKRW